MIRIVAWEGHFRNIRLFARSFQKTVLMPTRNTKPCIHPLNLLPGGVARRSVGTGVA